MLIACSSDNDNYDGSSDAVKNRRITKIVNENYDIAFTYDVQGRVVQAVKTIDQKSMYRYTYQYNETAISRDYEKEELAESCYDLARENDELKEKLSAITMVSDDEKQSIEHILELEQENKKLKDKVFFRDNRISWFEWEEERLNEEINKLKEENRKLKDIEAELLKEKKELLDKVNQLEQRLDNKEKVNKQLREDLGKLVMKS